MISKDYGCSTTTVKRLLTEKGIAARSISEAKRKYFLDEPCLDTIDDEEKAWLLGFLYADGYNNVSSHKIVISLAVYDRALLKKFGR